MNPSKCGWLRTTWLCILLFHSQPTSRKCLLSVCAYQQSFTTAPTFGLCESLRSKNAPVLVECFVKDEDFSARDLINILQKCRKERDIECAQRIYTHMCSNGLESYTRLGNFLVPMLVECGSVVYAEQVFHKLIDQNEFSWTSLMQGYLECGECQHAFDLFQKMQENSICPSKFTIQLLLKLCLRLNSVKIIHGTHVYIVEESYDSDSCVGNALVDTYAKCGLLAEAKCVFDRLSVQDVVSWTSLIRGYAEHDFSMDALHCWEHMQLHGVSPNVFTVASTLTLCGNLGALEKGQEVHIVVGKEGFEDDPFVGNTLVDFYGKCGCLLEAQDVFDELLVRDEVSWTALITGYAKHGFVKDAHACLEQMKDKSNLTCWNTLIAEYAELGFGEDALDCFDSVKREGLQPDAVTLTCSVKACGKVRCLSRGGSIHIEVAKMGYEKDSFIGNALVDMYCKCGAFLEAQRVFDELQVQDVVSWTALISGYGEHGLFKVAQSCLEEMGGEGLPITVTTWNALIAAYAEVGLGEEALKCFEKMQLKGVLPNSASYTSILKSCSWIGAIVRGREIHVKIVKEGLEGDPFVGNSLIDMYAKCGTLAEALHVFYCLPLCDEVSWSTLVAALAEHGLVYECLNSLQWMQVNHITPNASAFLHCLKACNSQGELTVGQNIYGKILEQGLEKHESIGTLLVSMYSKYDLLPDAQYVFNSLEVRDLSSWNALIAGYAEQGYINEVLECLRKMQQSGVFPDALTYACSLKGIDSSEALATGQQIHAEIAKDGLERDTPVGDMLLDLYAKYGFFAEAREVLLELLARNEASWTALIAGYAQSRLGNEALKCFEQMQLEGLCPRHDTFVWILKSCGNVRDIARGYSMHCEILKCGLERISFVGNSLVDMYIKFGFLLEAQRVFDVLPVLNVVSWNTMIMGCAENGLNEEALECAKRMQAESLAMDAITLVGILKACGNLGALHMGQVIHTEVAKEGFEKDSSVTSTLVDMYVKGGLLGEAREVFEELSVKDVISWTALITGYACEGDCEAVFGLFEKMKDEGILSDGVVVLSLLTVCSHAGLVDKGQKYFEVLIKENGILPTHEHYNSLIDLLARAGQLARASSFIGSAPLQPSLMSWIIMLGACRKWGDVDLGVVAFNCASELVGRQAVPYVLMFNLFADT